MIGRTISRTVPYVLLVLVIAISVALFLLSPTYQECMVHQPTTVTPTERILIFKECSGEFIKENEGAITALATFVIAVFTATLWATNSKQLHHSRQTERAYLAGGGDVEPAAANSKRSFRVEVANYGKTAARLYAFDVRFDTLARVQGIAAKDVTERWPYDDWIAPGGVATHKVIGRPIPIDDDDVNAIYGVFWYEDIWKERHFIRFILRIADDGKTRPDVTNIDKKYRDWS